MDITTTPGDFFDIGYGHGVYGTPDTGTMMQGVRRALGALAAWQVDRLLAGFAMGVRHREEQDAAAAAREQERAEWDARQRAAAVADDERIPF